MDFIFLGISALAFPIIIDSGSDRENKIKLNVLKNIYKKYQLVDDKTDVTKISDDYPLVICKSIQTEEIVDHEMGLSFKGVTGLSRNIQIAEKFGDGNSLQAATYKGTTNEELKKITDGKFTLSSFEVKAQNFSFRNIILRKNFLIENI